MQIEAKLLEIVTGLLLTAYKNLPMPYPTIPTPTPYNIPFSHKTQCYRQMDVRAYQQPDHTKYGQLKTDQMHKIKLDMQIQKADRRPPSRVQRGRWLRVEFARRAWESWYSPQLWPELPWPRPGRTGNSTTQPQTSNNHQPCCYTTLWNTNVRK